MSVGTYISAIAGLKFLHGDPIPIGSPDSPPLILVDIWATWCGPCRTSMPHLSQLQSKYKDHLVVVGVTNEQDEAGVKKFMSNNTSKMQYHVALDTQDGAYNALMLPSGATGIPTVFLLLHNKVVFTGHPFDPNLEPSIQRAISELAVKRVTLSRDELMSKSIKELKGILDEHRAGHVGCVEKKDLVDRILLHCT